MYARYRGAILFSRHPYIHYSVIALYDNVYVRTFSVNVRRDLIKFHKMRVR